MIRILILALVMSLGASVARAQDRAGAPTASAAEIFASTCGFCHQDGGRVAGRGPKLAGTERTDEFILNRIRVGKEGAMPAYGRAFSEAQLRALVAYIRGLKDDAR